MVRSPRDADRANKQQSNPSCERLHAKHQHPKDTASGVSLLAAVRPALPGHHRLKPKWRAFTSVRGSANANCYTYCSSDAHLDRHSDSTSFVKWFHCSWKLAPDNVRQNRHRKRKEAEEAAPPRSPPVSQARRVCLTPNISTNAAPVHPNAGQLRQKAVRFGKYKGEDSLFQTGSRSSPTNSSSPSASSTEPECGEDAASRCRGGK